MRHWWTSQKALNTIFLLVILGVITTITVSLLMMAHTGEVLQEKKTFITITPYPLPTFTVTPFVEKITVTPTIQPTNEQEEELKKPVLLENKSTEAVPTPTVTIKPIAAVRAPITNPEVNQNYSIYNMHEHIDEQSSFDKYFDAMKASGLEKVVFLGSPAQTLFLSDSGFEEYEKNNEHILALHKQYPDNVIAFCTINPKDENNVDKVKKCIKNGGRGIKLYSGHSTFYNTHLNDASMLPVYDYCEEHNIPLMWHVNAGKPSYRVQFEEVLKAYPNLQVICPHFCLSSIRTQRLRYFFDTYPYFYTDISFGYFTKEGFDRISQNTSKYVDLFSDYPDRFLFGTDMVVTKNPGKDAKWIANFTMCYRHMLEYKRFYCKVGDFISGYEWEGLGLNSTLLERIYTTNAQEFFSVEIK